MKTKDLNIKWMLFLYMFIFVFVMLIVLWLFQTVFLNDFYKAIRTQQINTIAKTIEKNIDNEDLSELLIRLAMQDNNISFIIYDDYGDVIFSPGMADEYITERQIPVSVPAAPFELHPPQSVMQMEIKRLMETVKQNGGAYEARVGVEAGEMPIYRPERFAGRVPSLRGGNAENLTRISTAVNKDGETIYILIRTLITPVDATVMTIRYQLICISFVLLIVALILSLYFSKKFARPIMDINEAAKKLAAGNYSVKFSAAGYREINELNETLNGAAYELSRVERLRRELLANVSHDLRTPLTMITGFAEMIRDLPGENNPENAQVIVDESNRLTRLVGDLLDISRLESGNMETDRHVFCITQTVSENASRMETLLSGGRRVLFDCGEEAYVCANESQIAQVVYNLIANALNYSDGDVIIKQTLFAKTVLIEVRDKGHGISKEDLPYVWDRYYKASAPHKRSNVGSGLGLSIVKGVIESHNGNCGVQSEEGIGSVFWFELETVNGNQ